jgi:hypothetical protein
MEYVIFDRSIFHGDKFEAFQTSRLLEKVKDLKYRVYYTPSFIEETLHYGLYQKDIVRDQLRFLYDINSSHWFRLAGDIIQAELGLRYRHQLFHLLLDDEISTIISGSFDYTDGRVPIEDLRWAIDVKEQEKKRREHFRNIRLRLREEIPVGNYEFGIQFEHNVENYIKDGLMTFYEDTAGYLTRWQRYRQVCPFTENYLKGWFATAYLPVMDRAMRVDVNDHDDATQLAYLTWADIMVSDDTRFMRSAFELLYGNSDKHFYTSEEFLRVINH